MDKVVEEYEDIFTSPVGVPMHCHVNHSIDLTPDASFPNGPIYHHSVLENNEIKRYPIPQIDDLLDQLKGGGIFQQDRLKVWISPAKIQVIRDWPAPTTLAELHIFLGFTNFYCSFVLGFSHINWPLSQVTKGGAKAKLFWFESQQKTFVDLKHHLYFAPMLTLPDLQQTFEIEINASDYVIEAVLTQQGHPVAYQSETL
eukprot:PITA_07788